MTRFRALFAVSIASAAIACSSEDSSTSTATAGADAGTDAKASSPDGSTGRDDAGSTPDASDAGTTGTDGSAPGETCVGYGAGDSCKTEQGKPYGYVCFGGPPPGIDGCKETRSSASLGNNYCCTENDCVEQIDQSAQCSGVSGKPRRLQCPPTADGGSNVAPPAGCVEHNSGATALEKFYCCPP